MQELRVIIEHDEDDGYVAQCIDYDIIGFGATPELAMEEFVRAFMRHVVAAVHMGVPPLSDARQPPPEYRHRWEQAEGTRPVLHCRIPEFTICEVDDFDRSILPQDVSARVA